MSINKAFFAAMIVTAIFVGSVVGKGTVDSIRPQVAAQTAILDAIN